jgi:hypothetical protein
MASNPTPGPQRFDVPMRREPSTMTAHSRRVSGMGFERSRHRIWLPIMVVFAAAVIAGAVWFVREYGAGRATMSGEDPLRGGGAVTGGGAGSPDAGPGLGAGGVPGAPAAPGAPGLVVRPDVFATAPGGAVGAVDAGGAGPGRAAAGDAGLPVDVGPAGPGDVGPSAKDAAVAAARDAGGGVAAADGAAVAAMDFVEIVTYPAGAKVQVNFAKGKGDYAEIGKTPMRVQWPKGTPPPRVKLRKYHHETHRMNLREWQFGRTLRIELEYDDTW